MHLRNAFVFCIITFFARREAHAQESAAELLQRRLSAPYAVAISLDRLLWIGPYLQDGPFGVAGLSVAAGIYLRSSNIDVGEPFLPHAAPRLGVDITLPWRLSVGIAAGGGYSVAGVDPYGGTEEPDRTATTLVAILRFGYLHPLGNDAMLWFRTGLAYSAGEGEHRDPYYQEDRFASRMRHVAMPVEFSFLFPVTRRFVLTFGVNAEVGLWGMNTTTTTWGGTLSKPEKGYLLNDAFGLSFGALTFL